MSVLQHQILTDKKVGEWLAAAASEDLNDVEQANLRLDTPLPAGHFTAGIAGGGIAGGQRL